MKLWRPRLSLKGCLIVGLIAPMLCYCANCVSFTVPLTVAYTRWQSTQPDTYTVIVHYSTFGFFAHSREETVENGVLLESPDRRPRIDQAFSEVLICAIDPIGLLMCEVEYDPHYGYPTRTKINDWDLGRITEIIDFRPE